MLFRSAGLATRYGGSKQTAGMGPHGEILLEYSACDAVRAGFDKLVFILRPEMLDGFRALCGDRLARRVRVEYAFQDFTRLPGWYAVPEGRQKPFGTVHAVLCARDAVREPFAVVNADDYYGPDAFRVMAGFLDGLNDPARVAMVGYRLKNTVSAHGSVTRGVCRVVDGRLADVREVQKIALRPDGAVVDVSEGEPGAPLDPDALVSMNFWGFHPAIFDAMDERFGAFLRALEPGELRGEYQLPVMVDQLLKRGGISVEVLGTDSVWFGVTYQQDRPLVQAALEKLHGAGVYGNLRE